MAVYSVQCRFGIKRCGPGITKIPFPYSLDSWNSCQNKFPKYSNKLEVAHSIFTSPRGRSENTVGREIGMGSGLRGGGKKGKERSHELHSQSRIVTR